MRIEDYFQQITESVNACANLQVSRMTYEKRSTHEGFIRGELHFVDSSVLHMREYVDVETAPDRLVYVYQYMDDSENLIFRYDNSGHHRKLNLATHPHHKHIGSEDKIVASNAPTLAHVLKEIDDRILAL